jgi:hypothetical protein
MGTVLVQSTDSLQTTADGFDFPSSDTGDTLIIDPNVFVTSQKADGVNSDGATDNTVINQGFIVSLNDFGDGVFLNSGRESLTNAANAEIYSSGQGGFAAAAALNGDVSNNLDNLGAISGARYGALFFQAAAGITATNFGTIFGEVAGIDIERVAASPFDGGSITNHGTISSSNVAILVDEDATHLGIVTSVTNLPNATITGSNGAITAGTLHLVNSGNIFGDIVVDGGGASVIVNKGHGAIAGQIFLEGGGADSVVTGKSSIHVHVGTGNDTLTAGSGHDQFIFDSALSGQIETIKGFTHGLDKIVLSLSDFASLGAPGSQLNAGHFDIGHATKPNPEIVYNPGNGFLFYDANGKAPGGLTHFATLVGHPTTSHADFLLEV